MYRIEQEAGKKKSKRRFLGVGKVEKDRARLAVHLY